MLHRHAHHVGLLPWRVHLHPFALEAPIPIAAFLVDESPSQTLRMCFRERRICKYNQANALCAGWRCKGKEQCENVLSVTLLPIRASTKTNDRAHWGNSRAPNQSMWLTLGDA